MLLRNSYTPRPIAGAPLSMLLKLISCNVFQREACWCIARSPNVVDVEFTELGEHVRSDGLRRTIEGKIDAAENSGRAYDAILILFGICGNASIGLTAKKTQLVIPRAHDCCTILLGSKQMFREHFEQNPSTPFGSAGYVERGSYFMRTDEGESRVHYGDVYAEYVAKYGEEDAKYIWEQMNPQSAANLHDDRAVFIDLPQTSHLGYAQQFQEKAEEAGKRYVRLEGSIRLIQNLIDGKWDEADYLIVRPGRKIGGVYDFDEVVRAKDQ